MQHVRLSLKGLDKLTYMVIPVPKGFVPLENNENISTLGNNKGHYQGANKGNGLWKSDYKSNLCTNYYISEGLM